MHGSPQVFDYKAYKPAKSNGRNNILRTLLYEFYINAAPKNVILKRKHIMKIQRVDFLQIRPFLMNKSRKNETYE